jgi:hypothetical protein
MIGRVSKSIRQHKLRVFGLPDRSASTSQQIAGCADRHKVNPTDADRVDIVGQRFAWKQSAYADRDRPDDSENTAPFASSPSENATLESAPPAVYFLVLPSTIDDVRLRQLCNPAAVSAGKAWPPFIPNDWPSNCERRKETAGPGGVSVRWMAKKL